jgi:tetratricopeptide (TPR) repeat protein
MKHTSKIVGLILLAVLTGCGAAGSASSEPPTLNARVDSGNHLYALGDHAAALEHYRAAVAEDETDPAAWFGVYMASRALDDAETAAAALARVQQLVPDAALSDHPHEPRPASPHASPSPHSNQP